MDDSALQAAYAELRSSCEFQHTPKRVKAALFSLSERQTELFTTEFDSGFAIGASNGIYAT